MSRINRTLRIPFLAVLLAAATAYAGGESGSIIKLGPGSDPQWSPDGKLISLISDGYLQVTPADGKGPRTKLAEYRGEHYVWASDTEIVWSERPNRNSDTTLFKSVVFRKIIDSAAKAEGSLTVSGPSLVTRASGDTTRFERIYGPVRLPDGAVGFYRAEASIFGPVRFEPLHKGTVLTARERRFPKIVIKKSGERFAPIWGELWISSVADTAERRLSNDESFGMVAMAPTGDKFIARSTKRNAFVIFDTSGNELNSRFEPLNTSPSKGQFEGASHMTWSPDGKRLCYLKTLDDGHVILSMSLMVSNIANRDPVQILGYDSGELGSFTWSPDGTRIAVSTLKDGVLELEVLP